MAKAKKVYVVNGSEDGNLGVYSNKKLAYACAATYTEMNGGPVETYAQVCKVLRDWDSVKVESKSEYGSARITEFVLNAPFKD